jgi:hypothetical protein
MHFQYDHFMFYVIKKIVLIKKIFIKKKYLLKKDLHIPSIR